MKINKRLRNIEDFLNSKNISMISFIEDIKNHNILYKKVEDITEEDLNDFNEKIRLSVIDKFNKLLDLPVKFFDSTKTGDIISRISYDIDTINTSLSSDVIAIISSVLTVVGSFIMMFQISKILILVLL